jgi:hypothetical protein
MEVLWLKTGLFMYIFSTNYHWRKAENLGDDLSHTTDKLQMPYLCIYKNV